MFALQILVILHVLLLLIVNPMAFFFLLYWNCLGMTFEKFLSDKWNSNFQNSCKEVKLPEISVPFEYLCSLAQWFHFGNIVQINLHSLATVLQNFLRVLSNFFFFFFSPFELVPKFWNFGSNESTPNLVFKQSKTETVQQSLPFLFIQDQKLRVNTVFANTTVTSALIVA